MRALKRPTLLRKRVRFTQVWTSLKLSQMLKKSQKQQLELLGKPPQLNGFICTNYPVALGLNPNHTIYALLLFMIEIVVDFGIRKGRK